MLEETVDNHQRRTFEDGVVHKDEGTVEYAMAPVWILTTRYDGKAYTFIDKAYVGQNLLDSDIIDGSTISVLAIRGKDDKWTALRIVSPSHGQV